MGLTGHALLAVCLAVALAAPVATVRLWSRRRGGRLLTVLRRGLLILLGQLAAVAVVAVLVNDSYDFYGSWSDLVGGSAVNPAVGRDGVLPASGVVEAAAITARFRAHRIPGGGAVLDQTIVGRRSGLRAPATIYLPPQYDSPAYARTRFPVVLVMPGYPGNPRLWMTHLHLPLILAREVVAHRAVPFVAVVVKETVVPPRDTECADVVHGPQVETFLAQDVREQVVRALRVRADRGGWALMGDSTGGFCATKLAMRHPTLFASAVSVAGYYTTVQDRTTGDLYGGNRRLRAASSPLWRLEHLRAPPVAVAVTTTRQERDYRETLAFARAARPPMQVLAAVMATGGHNTRTWSVVLPPCLDWLGQRFGPLTAGAGTAS